MNKYYYPAKRLTLNNMTRVWTASFQNIKNAIGVENTQNPYSTNNTNIITTNGITNSYTRKYLYSGTVHYKTQSHCEVLTNIITNNKLQTYYEQYCQYVRLILQEY